jgi:DNA polymerase
MSLDLDARRRAMLAEMGVRVWWPEPVLAPESPESTPETIAARGQSALGEAEKGIKRGTENALEPRSTAPSGPERTVAAPRPAPSASGVDVGALDWDALREAVTACRACGLCQGRTQTVFGVGDRQADWMVVGEAPGEQEDLKGEPFVGPSGQLLDNMLKTIGLSRRAGGGPVGGAETAEDGAMAPAEPAAPVLRGVYIANVVKCRPPGNRNPHPDEVLKCDPYLARQVALVRPKIILAMGRFAVQSLLRSTEPIGKLRGRVHHYQGVPVIVTYHPAYLLRSLPEKAKAWADLCLAMDVAERGA